jgi:hypothetical protein
VVGDLVTSAGAEFKEGDEVHTLGVNQMEATTLEKPSVFHIPDPMKRLPAPTGVTGVICSTAP